MSVPSDDQPHTRTRYPAGEAPDALPSSRHPLRTVAMVLAVVVVLVVAVAVINRTSGSTSSGNGTPSSTDGTKSTASSSSTAATGTAPVTGTTNGIATGYPHTSEGAQSAAANYDVALGSADMYAETTRHAIVAAVAVPASQTALLAKFDPAYTSLAGKLGLKDGQAPAGLTFISRSIPVGTKVDAFTPDTATIEVWSNSVGGLAGTGSTSPVTEYWYTLTLKLQWSGNDWKVSDYNQVDGPAPISGSQSAASSQSITNAVTQFGGFRYAR